MKFVCCAHTMLAVAAVALVIQSTMAEITIGMKPIVTVPDEVDKFAGFYFEPYKPAPTVQTSCYDFCPCSLTPREFTTCDCDVEQVCGGEIGIDLSSGDKITFNWDASSNESKYITIKGNGRTRIEFQGKYPCPGDNKYQSIKGKDISFTFDFVDRDGYADTNKETQSYEYNADTSFLDLGQYPGGNECEIFTRLQFDPLSPTGLELNFKTLSFSANYNMSDVAEGVQNYEWGTNLYCWMRDSNDGRRRGRVLAVVNSDGEDGHNSRELDEENTYEIKNLPEDDSSAPSVAPSVAPSDGVSPAPSVSPSDGVSSPPSDSPDDSSGTRASISVSVLFLSVMVLF